MIEHLLTPYISERYASDGRYRRGHIRIINPLPGTRILGLHIPDMKKTAVSLAKSPEAIEIIDSFEQAPDRSLYYEEYMVWGMMLCRMKLDYSGRTERMRKFIPHIDNWAVCDSICSFSSWARPDSRTWEFIFPYFSSKKEFEVRFALILYMARMMEESNLEKALRLMENIDLDTIRSEYTRGKVRADNPDLCPGLVAGEPPYYVRMGMAWLLATALARYPDTLRSLLAHTRLPEDILRLYVRKARESFRTRTVSPF